jgi:predicted nucleic acid-binding protein
MNPSVYIETSVIGYLTSWPREDVTVAGHQNTTKLWWSTAAERFDLFVSQLVARECSDGDPDAVKDRLASIDGLPVLPITTEVETLADALIQGHAVPGSHPNDALHIAVAAVHGVQYLVSWNFRHIVNASLRPAIERVCRDTGYDPPIICTPEELLEGNDD